MSYDASIHSYGYESPITTEILREISPGQGWPAGTIANSAPSQPENDPQLAMDRLLREYLTPKSPWG